MLEKIYKQIDIVPDGFPFVKPTLGNLYPSSDWVSSSKKDYKLVYIPGPPPKWPPLPARDKSRSNNPQGNIAYHIDKFGREKICAVRTSLPHLGAGDVMGDPRSCKYFSTETQIRFKAPKATERDLWIGSAKEASVGIVPANELTSAKTDLLFPACSKHKAVTMTSTPALQYIGKKKRLRQPFQDNGILYSDGEQKMDDRYWHSVSSLCGQPFSRRRVISAPHGDLPGFDGGASAEKRHSWYYGIPVTGSIRQHVPRL